MPYIDPPPPRTLESRPPPPSFQKGEWATWTRHNRGQEREQEREQEQAAETQRVKAAAAKRDVEKAERNRKSMQSETATWDSGTARAPERHD